MNIRVFITLSLLSMVGASGEEFKSIETLAESIGGLAFAESLNPRVTGYHTISTQGLPEIEKEEWDAYLETLESNGSQLKYFTIAPYSDSVEVPFFSIYLSVENCQYWIQPKGLEAQHDRVYGPVQFRKTEAGSPVLTNAET